MISKSVSEETVERASRGGVHSIQKISARILEPKWQAIILA